MAIYFSVVMAADALENANIHVLCVLDLAQTAAPLARCMHSVTFGKKHCLLHRHLGKLCM